ncbi:acyl-CoA dehydrogenase family protein [Microbacterium oleivorans]|uniref:acyl-CoA dehydrogenase family protein n=1 Tax=Microbacterium oleivorans TaxID=273677 RepID=UPI002116A3BB|nr:acyl-CoA dehydrogenase family protein [Microbacterium oleivorans]
MRDDSDDPAALSLRDDRTVGAPVLAALRSADDTAGFGVDIAATLAWAVSVGRARAVERDLVDDWELLASVAARDVTAARILEPHLDALDILDQARRDGHDIELDRVGAGPASSWGVFAAEGAGVRLEAHERRDGWTLTGTKPWCSLAAHVSHALVTAWAGDTRRLFAVDLRADGVSPRPGPWHARGLASVVSAPVDFAAAPAATVGDPGWYLRRTGFARGGVGVAACWWGGAAALRAPLRAAAQRSGADQLSRVHLARVDTALWAARLALADAARSLDAPAPPDPALTAARVRTLVAQAAETALHEADHALGPLPLVADEEHARRAADLQLYLRQHHAERDLARIGGDLADGRGAW